MLGNTWDFTHCAICNKKVEFFKTQHLSITVGAVQLISNGSHHTCRDCIDKLAEFLRLQQKGM